MLVDTLIWIEDNLWIVAGGGTLAAAIILAAVFRRRKSNTAPLPSPEVIGVPAYLNDDVFQDQEMSFGNLSGVEARSTLHPSFDPVNNAADARNLLLAIQGDPPQGAFSATYLAGTFLVAGAMLLLPLIYLGFVGSVLWGIYAYSQMDSTVIRGSSPTVIRSLVYVAPYVIGGVVAIFLLKPFFARRQKGVAPVELKETDQPLLFAFIQELCITLKAPMPKRILLCCDANASASLRRGLWSIFRRGDLQLTIGLKLVQGLQVQDFAGVLAHEFGHFTQGTAMRINAVIYAINRWFARLVYEKDSWDETLDELISSSPSLLPVIFLFAKVAVLLGRGLLWVLLQVAHALSCLLMRQQEYDADRYEAYIAGSTRFSNTMDQIVALNIVSDISEGFLNQGVMKMVLPSNCIDVFQRCYNNLPSSFFDGLPKIIEGEKKSWFSTHPTSTRRIAHVQKLQLPGIFKAPTAPASVLFRSFGQLCEQATLNFYQVALGRLVDKRITASTEEFLRRINIELPVKPAAPPLVEVAAVQ